MLPKAFRFCKLQITDSDSKLQAPQCIFRFCKLQIADTDSKLQTPKCIFRFCNLQITDSDSKLQAAGGAFWRVKSEIETCS